MVTFFNMRKYRFYALCYSLWDRQRFDWEVVVMSLWNEQRCQTSLQRDKPTHYVRRRQKKHEKLVQKLYVPQKSPICKTLRKIVFKFQHFLSQDFYHGLILNAMMLIQNVWPEKVQCQFLRREILPKCARAHHTELRHVWIFVKAFMYVCSLI